MWHRRLGAILRAVTSDPGSGSVSTAWLPPPSLDLSQPPPDLMALVTGRTDPELFDLSGQVAVDDFAVGLARLGRRYEDFSSELDFGCGCGRVLRWLAGRMPHARL